MENHFRHLLLRNLWEKQHWFSHFVGNIKTSLNQNTIAARSRHSLKIMSGTNSNDSNLAPSTNSNDSNLAPSTNSNDSNLAPSTNSNETHTWA